MEKIQGYCIVLDKGWMDFDMTWPKWFQFWSYMNSAIKMQNTDAFLLAEVYNTKEYRNYIRLGKWIICMIRWRPMIKRSDSRKSRHLTDFQKFSRV
jgi:hypothetical protein